MTVAPTMDDQWTFVGIDAGKQSLEVCMLPENTSATFVYSEEGLRLLCRLLPTAGTCFITINATGKYQRHVSAVLQDAGHIVALVNPLQVRNYVNALSGDEKTDRPDAVATARFGKDVRPPTVEETLKKHEELRQLALRGRQLVELQVAETKRLETYSSQTALNSVEAMIQFVDTQIPKLEEQITQLIATGDDWNVTGTILASVPGAGPIAVASLLTELPELGLLGREEIGALVGLAPSSRDRDEHQVKRSGRGGRQSVRDVLYRLTWTTDGWNPVVRDFAERLLADGKAFEVVITASTRKFLTILNTLVKNSTPWKPDFPSERRYTPRGR